MKERLLRMLRIGVYVVCHTDDEKVCGLQVFLNKDKAWAEFDRLKSLYRSSTVYFGSKRVI